MAFAALLILAVFSSLLLSASPALHEHVHHDAAQSSHQCAITVFQQQQFLTNNPNVFVVERNLGVPLKVIVPDHTAVSDYDYRFSASRAPPFSVSPFA